jgi:hypothetical protein
MSWHDDFPEEFHGGHGYAKFPPGLVDAVKALRTKMEKVCHSPEYLGVWQMAMVHGMPYTGENWVEEAQAVDTLLKGYLNETVG